MSSRSRKGLRQTVAAVSILLGAAVLWAPASPASAHNYLVASNPAEGAVLTELPDRFSVTTNDSLLDLGGLEQRALFEVTDSNGTYYGDGCVTIEGPSIYTAAELGAAGEYTVQWVVVSLDGHPVDGEYTFEWDPAEDFTPAEGSSSEPVCSTATGSTEQDGAAQVIAEEEASSATATSSNSDVIWLVGGFAAVLIVGAVTIVILRRQKPGSR